MAAKSWQRILQFEIHLSLSQKVFFYFRWQSSGPVTRVSFPWLTPASTCSTFRSTALRNVGWPPSLFFFLPTYPRTNSHPNSCNSVTPVSWTASSCHYSPLEKLLSGDLVFTYSFTLVTAKPMLKEKLKFKLSQAIQQTKGFGLV